MARRNPDADIYVKMSMQDDKEREPEREQPTDESRRSSPLQPYSKPENPPEEPETVSLLDLMAEEAEVQGQ